MILMRPAPARYPVFRTRSMQFPRKTKVWGLANQDDSRNNLRRVEPLALFGLGWRP
ncbi:hypothetical protein ABIB68_007029 [Bradyrhizobium sp. F1.2.2]